MQMNLSHVGMSLKNVIAVEIRLAFATIQVQPLPHHYYYGIG
jgi:hypothetical protein